MLKVKHQRHHALNTDDLTPLPFPNFLRQDILFLSTPFQFRTLLRRYTGILSVDSCANYRETSWW